MNQYSTDSIPGFAEPLSSLSHLAGAILFALLTLPLLRVARMSDFAAGGWRTRTLSTGVFAMSVIFLLSISGLYHALPFASRSRELLLRLDYLAIFLLIAGTFTPTCAIMLRGIYGRSTLTAIWGMTGLGICVHWFFPAWIPYRWNIAIYLGIGWLGALAARSASRRYGLSLVEPLVLGGSAYTAGVAFLLAGRPQVVPGVLGPHELFHIAVLIGISCHWVFVWRLAEGGHLADEMGLPDAMGQLPDPIDGVPAWIPLRCVRPGLGGDVDSQERSVSS
ncbi:MAG: DNA-binding protein [Planctomycetales bacterium]|nr:DNA-binding protein [Planctomycetales bacterium]NIP68557.1 DNA-binding protein [Planctomycetales bacterium]